MRVAETLNIQNVIMSTFEIKLGLIAREQVIPRCWCGPDHTVLTTEQDGKDSSSCN